MYVKVYNFYNSIIQYAFTHIYMYMCACVFTTYALVWIYINIYVISISGQFTFPADNPGYTV